MPIRDRNTYERQGYEKNCLIGNVYTIWISYDGGGGFGSLREVFRRRHLHQTHRYNSFPSGGKTHDSLRDILRRRHLHHPQERRANQSRPDGVSHGWVESPERGRNLK